MKNNEQNLRKIKNYANISVLVLFKNLTQNIFKNKVIIKA